MTWGLVTHVLLVHDSPWINWKSTVCLEDAWRVAFPVMEQIKSDKLCNCSNLSSLWRSHGRGTSPTFINSGVSPKLWKQRGIELPSFPNQPFRWEIWDLFRCHSRIQMRFCGSKREKPEHPFIKFTCFRQLFHSKWKSGCSRNAKKNTAMTVRADYRN